MGSLSFRSDISSLDEIIGFTLRIISDIKCMWEFDVHLYRSIITRTSNKIQIKHRQHSKRWFVTQKIMFVCML
jgi:hypothetical protein